MSRLSVALIFGVMGLPAKAAENVSPAGDDTPIALEPFHVRAMVNWGLSFKHDRNRKIKEIVVHAPKGSHPANAGLKTGDRLIALDGHAVLGISSQEYGALEQSIRGSRKGKAFGQPVVIRYTVLRGREKLEFSFDVSAR